MKIREVNRYLLNSIPKPFKYALQKHTRRINFTFANYILDSAYEWSKMINGDTTCFNRRLRKLIIRNNTDCNTTIQDILTAFMPDYRNNLYEYYKNQEYLIFYRFLTYPFTQDMSSYIIPYENALLNLESSDICDYGAGVPYGLIFSLLNNKGRINSITLIDLDLVHVDFVAYLINKISPNVKLRIIRLRDATSFPKLEGQYNLFYGKDIFEHLNDPLKNLGELLSYSKDQSICYFDFNDHGEMIYQHITPNIEYLKGEMEKLGFRYSNKVCGMSEFVKIV